MRKFKVDLSSIGESYEIFIDGCYYGISNDSLKNVENLASAKKTLLKLGELIDLKRCPNSDDYECTLKVEDGLTILECAKEVAKLMLAEYPLKIDGFPYFCQHPFTSTLYVTLMKEEKTLFLDISNNEEFELWKKLLSDNIDNQCKSVLDIAYLMNNDYYLTFMHRIKKFISSEDMGTMLNYFFPHVLDPNLDKNVTRKELLALFKYADKKTLMSAEELEKYNSFEDEVIIYRGVTPVNKHIKNAISWTLDKNVAKEFSNYFKVNDEEKYGEVWEIKVPKDRILCYWDSVEKEVIVDLYKRGKGEKKDVCNKV